MRHLNFKRSLFCVWLKGPHITNLVFLDPKLAEIKAFIQTKQTDRTKLTRLLPLTIQLIYPFLNTFNLHRVYKYIFYLCA